MRGGRWEPWPAAAASQDMIQQLQRSGLGRGQRAALVGSVPGDPGGHTHSVLGAGSCPGQPASPGGPARLARETEAERGLHRCGQGEGRGMRGCGPVFGATPTGRVVRAGKSVSTSVFRVVTRDLAVPGGRGFSPCLPAPSSLHPFRAAEGRELHFPMWNGWGVAALLKLIWSCAPRGEAGRQQCPSKGSDGGSAVLPSQEPSPAPSALNHHPTPPSPAYPRFAGGGTETQSWASCSHPSWLLLVLEPQQAPGVLP